MLSENVPAAFRTYWEFFRNSTGRAYRMCKQLVKQSHKLLMSQCNLIGMGNSVHLLGFKVGGTTQPTLLAPTFKQFAHKIAAAQ